jgi:hypothetical protein
MTHDIHEGRDHDDTAPVVSHLDYIAIQCDVIIEKLVEIVTLLEAQPGPPR